MGLNYNQHLSNHKCILNIAIGIYVDTCMYLCESFLVSIFVSSKNILI